VLATAQARASQATAELERTRTLLHDRQRMRAFRFKAAGASLLSFGLAAVVGGTAAALVARSQRDDLLAQANRGAVYDPSVTDAARHADTATIALFTTGGVITALGASLLGYGLHSERALP
jgi:hypothetical protein